MINQNSPAVPIPVTARQSVFTVDRLTTVLYPTLTFILLLVVWEGAVTLFEVPSYLFPRIRPVLKELIDGYIGGSLLHTSLIR